jgi:hypothetical protein
MNDFEKWANEYKKSADSTRAKIFEMESKVKKRGLSFADEKKLKILYEMYADCLYAYKMLLRRHKK